MYKIKQPLFNADGETGSYFPASWGDVLSNASESIDDQPDTESEDETFEDGEELEESDEVEQEEETSDEETTEEESEEEDTSPPDEDPDVELGEGKKPVKLSELKSGYLRQADYTKKTQELSTQRKEIETLQETLKPVQEWQKHMESNPWLWQQFNTALQEFNSTGTLPLEEVLQDAQYGKYLNHLMAENNALKKERDELRGEYEGVKLSSEMMRVQNELKADYGDLVTDEYMQQLQERAKEEKLSAATLKDIAEGHLAKQALKGNKKDVKEATRKAEAQAIQRLAETKRTAPSAPKSTGVTPTKAGRDTSGGWEGFFKQFND